MAQFDVMAIIVVVLLTHVVDLWFANRVRNQLSAMDQKLEAIKASLGQNK